MRQRWDAFSTLIRRKELESSALAYLAAIEGSGVALAQTILVEDELRTGALVPAHPHALDRNTNTYHFVCEHRTPKRETLDRLRRWLAADGHGPKA